MGLDVIHSTAAVHKSYSDKFGFPGTEALDPSPLLGLIFPFMEIEWTQTVSCEGLVPVLQSSRAFSADGINISQSLQQALHLKQMLSTVTTNAQ